MFSDTYAKRAARPDQPVGSLTAALEVTPEPQRSTSGAKYRKLTQPTSSTADCFSQATVSTCFTSVCSTTPKTRRRTNVLSSGFSNALLTATSAYQLSGDTSRKKPNALVFREAQLCFDNSRTPVLRSETQTDKLYQNANSCGADAFPSILETEGSARLQPTVENWKCCKRQRTISCFSYFFLTVICFVFFCFSTCFFINVFLVEVSQGHCWYEPLRCTATGSYVSEAPEKTKNLLYSQHWLHWASTYCQRRKDQNLMRVMVCKPSAKIWKTLRLLPSNMYTKVFPHLYLLPIATAKRKTSTPSKTAPDDAFTISPSQFGKNYATIVNQGSKKTSKEPRNHSSRKKSPFAQLLVLITKKYSSLKPFFNSSLMLLTNSSKFFPSFSARRDSSNTETEALLFSRLEENVRSPALSGRVEHRLQTSPQSQALRRHSKEFEKRIEIVTPEVYVGIGYGLANVVVIQARSTGGFIVIDTLESPLAMKEFMQDLKKLLMSSANSNGLTLSTQATNRSFYPENANADSVTFNISCVIYTHFHSDHTFGAGAIVTAGVTPIWAHEKTYGEIERVFSLVGGATYKRSMHQFGSFLLEEDGYLNAGIGKQLRYSATPKKNDKLSTVWPTHIWSGTEKRIEVDGEVLHLLYAPGESSDQTVVWLPEKRLLMGADNIYKAFPNIYAIRGTPSRDAMQWVHSLDRMRFLFPEYLVLGHTSVLKGKQVIWETITAYRDAIQYIHDQTVRYMNKGYPVNAIVDKVRLPDHLESHPYLQQLYGTVPWAVRGVFQHYVGWFSGRAEDLHPLSMIDRAKRMVEMVGGRRILLDHAYNGLKAAQYQWSLELATYVLELTPECPVARELRILALKGLASSESSAPGRNWYLTAAKVESEKRGYVAHNPPSCTKETRLSRLALPRWQSSRSASCSKNQAYSVSEGLRLSLDQKKQCIDSMVQAADIFEYFSVRIKEDMLVTQDLVIGFHFNDVDAFTCWHVRRGVVYPRSVCERETTFEVTTTDYAWRQILKGEIRPIVAIATGRLRVSSGRAKDYWKLKKVMSAIELTME